ncbi:protein NLRC5-like [Sardina pilchardus]|uniref:protein NLRC5-like n=1 Tax=Sardina pilchardus TaxID=27697 RepID=UPI002E155B50
MSGEATVSELGRSKERSDSGSVMEKRSASPTQSSVSMKSDHSKGDAPDFREGAPSSDQSGMEKRSASPTPSCVSMKSDHSKGDAPDFREGAPSSDQREQRRRCELEASGQNLEQHDLKHIFQVLEEKIITFVKNELKRFKCILSPDYKENFERKEEDESDAREGALKMALHFLWKMERKDLADMLQAHELDVVCQAELKRNHKRKYQSVFEGIPKQGFSALLEQIYTEIYVTEGESGQVNEEHEVRQIECRSKRPTGQKTSIKCNDIFTPLPGQGKPIRRVITTGVAGIGKSISVQKYILDWAEGDENQDIHFLFPLPFRELNLIREQCSLIGLLHKFFSDIKELTFDSQRKYKMLFVFDGLDECRLQLNFQENEYLTDATQVTSLDVVLTNLIKGNLFPSALLWITSRPAAFHRIPPGCVDRVTEAQGFSDLQKEKYFRKRISDEDLADSIISHIKSSRTLHIMCHIPVFCWIAATVFVEILGSSKDNPIPKTLTEMYTYFLIFQTMQRSLKFENMHDVDPQWNQGIILDLGKLAYEQLEKGNLIFYEEDLKESGIDIREAAVCSGICTQIFREESVIHQAKVFCFVHLSIQEYLAALYAFLMVATERKDIVSQHQARCPSVEESMVLLHKNALDKALQYEDGCFDLFLRFLLGLSLESNQILLRGLLPKRQNQMEDNKETISYIKEKIREMPASERVINLFHCLNEINDHSLVEEVQSFLSAGTLSEATLSPAQWSALVFVLMTSQQKLDVFDLRKYIRSDEALLRLRPVVEESQTALLNSCRLTERSCTTLAGILSKSSSKLKYVDLRDNSIGDTGVQELCNGLENPNCALETLRLDNNSITEDGCDALTSALRSNPSHLIDLNLSGNKLGDSGVKHISALLEKQDCKLEKLELLDCSITGDGYAVLASTLKSNPTHLVELDLRGNDPGDSAVELLTDLYNLLNDSECKLQTLRLLKSKDADEVLTYLTSVGINPLLQTELDLSGEKLGDLRVKQLSALLEESHCRLQKLKLSDCNITGDGYAALASALKSNPSHLVELDLKGNNPGVSAVELLTDLYHLLNDSECKLKTLRLLKSKDAEEVFAYLTSVGINPLLQTELDLSGKKLGDTTVKQLSALLEDSHCRLQKLKLSDCGVTGEGYAALASALKSNPSHLVELDLRGNDPGDSAVELITDLYSLVNDPSCILQTLRLLKSKDAEEVCAYLTSVGINPLLQTELDLSGKKLGDSRVKQLSALLEESHCKLQKLKLSDCGVTGEGYAALASALKSNPSHLVELDLRGNDPGDSAVELITDLYSLVNDPSCILQTLRLLKSKDAEEVFAYLTSVGINPLLQTELDLSGKKLGDSRVKQLSALLKDSHCRLQKLKLNNSLTKKDCDHLTSALTSNPSHLIELDLSGNKLGDSGVNLISDLLKNPLCKLQKLGLNDNNITEEGCAHLTEALTSNPSHLIELDLSGNKLGNSGVKHIAALLKNPDCKLLKLLLNKSNIKEEGCAALTSALTSNPSHLIELNLSGNRLGDSGVKHISALLENPLCKLQKLELMNTSMKTEGYDALTSALKSNPSHLIELDLSGNSLENSVKQELSALVKDPQYKLWTLRFDSEVTDPAMGVAIGRAAGGVIGAAAAKVIGVAAIGAIGVAAGGAIGVAAGGAIGVVAGGAFGAVVAAVRAFQGKRGIEITETRDGSGGDTETRDRDGSGGDTETRDGSGGDTETRDRDGSGGDTETRGGSGGDTETRDRDGSGGDTETRDRDGSGGDTETRDGSGDDTETRDRDGSGDDTETRDGSGGDTETRDRDGSGGDTETRDRDGSGGDTETRDGSGDDTETRDRDGSGGDTETRDGSGDDTETRDRDGSGGDTETRDRDGSGGDTETRDGSGGDTETRDGSGDDTETRDGSGGDTETRDGSGGDTETRDGSGGDTETRGGSGGDTETRDGSGGDTETRGGSGGDTETRDGSGGDTDPLRAVDNTEPDPYAL